MKNVTLIDFDVRYLHILELVDMMATDHCHAGHVTTWWTLTTSPATSDMATIKHYHEKTLASFIKHLHYYQPQDLAAIVNIRVYQDVHVHDIE